ncbi:MULTISPECIES: hypothetical protein [Halocynthiibacter]|uniref:Uncharacterized protein n=1 Tax=Halocynthiibacter halioticoli TaxID=2986804 RepID=A0AAE3IVS9_9RHOB|nr:MULTISPECIES: hypothetical protein [Halocynthiibacter]MCV6822924.1 hypothetical protein [Halocynthiibacter halioticoli]MCW4055925.1 hypothetical protein [Halocynthiibacter sp. SDUM655004]
MGLTITVSRALSPPPMEIGGQVVRFLPVEAGADIPNDVAQTPQIGRAIVEYRTGMARRLFMNVMPCIETGKVPDSVMP